MTKRYSKYGFHRLVNPGDAIDIDLHDGKDAQRIRSAAWSYGRSHGMRLRVSILPSKARIVFSYTSDAGNARKPVLGPSVAKWNKSPLTRFNDLAPGSKRIIRDVSEAESGDLAAAVRKYAKFHRWQVSTRRLVGGGLEIIRHQNPEGVRGKPRVC